MYYVYILRSLAHASESYIGITEDIEQRLADHNAGRSPHTSKYRPWRLECFIALPDKDVAFAFEKYLKTHSGRAFASKRLLRRHE